MKRFASLALTALFVCLTAVNSFALTDDKIFTDTVNNTYEGRAEAKDMVNNLKFSDIPSNYWAREAIVRAGALNMVKGYENQFMPAASVSKQEAIAFAVRVMGLEDEAQAEGVRLNALTESTSARPVWSIGYLSVAQQNGLITPAQYYDAIAEDETDIDPETGFYKNAPASRQEVATWIVRALQYLNPDAFLPAQTQQTLYSFSDWEQTSAEHAADMELCVSRGIIKGDANGLLRPAGSLTRAEMAQILSNMDTIYNAAAGLEKKNGTVGGIRDIQSSQTNSADVWRNIYVRSANGLIDVVQYQLTQSSSPQAKDKDAVVIKGPAVASLTSLEQGDTIEYLVNPISKEVLFVKVTGDLSEKTVEGTLEQVDYANGQLHIIDSTSKRFIYYMADGLYGSDDPQAADTSKNYLYFGETKYYNDKLPYGDKLTIELKNNVAARISYVGQPVLESEIRGIVVENNENLGYLTIVDNDGNLVTKNYYADDMVVEKQQYYDSQDEIGYIDQVFPNFKYDARDTTISSVEAGDIVFVRLAPDDSETIQSISASPNYTMKYGKIRDISTQGSISQILIEYEDKQTAWFDVANSVFISRSGKPIKMSDVQSGEWVKLLVNQAIIQPGYVMESVKEIMAEGSGHEISSIIKGQLGAVNALQNQLSIQHAYTLTTNGWDNYQEIKQLSIDNNDIAYYYEGERVSLDYVTQFLKRADGEVYVAMENNYAGEKISMISFRNSRGEIFDGDTVIDADGAGGFATVTAGRLTTDAGTIVRRYGRLVDGNDIMIPDYAQVVLNGGSNAAVVDIYDTPGAESVMIARGRILSIDDGKSFKVKSMSILNDMKWNYTPVEREFTIDHETIFMNSTGIVSQDSFIDYTDATVVNKAYNIIADGTRATHIIDAPYTTKAVRGTVYNVGANTIGLRSGTYYANDSGVWDSVSSRDSSISINTDGSCVFIKNDKVVGINSIAEGDKLKVYVSELPDRITGSMTLNGYIVIVES